MSILKRSTIGFLGAAALLLLAGTGSTEPQSSRRWIKEAIKMAYVRSGIQPVDEKALRAIVERALAEPPLAAEKARGPRNFQVNVDLLPPDGTGFQPETQSEVHVAINPEKETNLVAGFQEGRFVDGGARGLGFAVSTDGGKKWRTGLIPKVSTVNGGTYQGASDPWVAFGPGNRVYYTSLLFNSLQENNALAVSTSTDGGQTWGDPVIAHQSSNEFDDKQAIVVDNRNDSPYKGRLYLGWDSVNDTSQILRVNYSADGGLSFTQPVVLHSQGVNIGFIPLVGPRGVVHAFWTHADIINNALGNFAVWTSRSDDGGDTWSAPSVVAPFSPTGVQDLRTGGILPSAALDPRNGSIYVVWQEDRFTPGVAQVMMTRSTNGGASWTAPRIISDGPRNAANFTPAVVVNPLGKVGVLYSSLRNDPARRYGVDTYITFSLNGGRSFTRSTRLSTQTFDARFAALAEGGFFLGDYQGLAAGRTTFHPVWVATMKTSDLDPPAREPDVFTRPVKR
jgi:hypothetical protein